jgi:HD-like signal output (HDOD) protein
MSINQSIQSRIKSLPPLPESVIKIQDICNNPESGIGDLTKVVEKDPMLTANLLKAANSPLYGFSREIKNVSQAVSLFGMATVKGFALASAVKNSIKIDMSPYGIDTEGFARLSQMQSALMVNWYSKVDRSKMMILSPASFLDGVGQIILAQELITSGKANEFKSKLADAESVEALEDEFFGTVSPVISAEVFQHWRFEEEMVKAIAASYKPEEAEDDIKDYGYALKIVRMCVNPKGKFEEASLAKARELVESLGLDVAHFNSALETTQL